jgi:hypothetical protein
LYGSEGLRSEGHDAEETLRLVAAMPPPEGLTDRVHAQVGHHLLGVARDSTERRGFWSLWMPVRRLQFAGAAVLVIAVAGSTWGVYHSKSGAAVVRPGGATPATGGFGSAGAVRVPPTLAPIQVPPWVSPAVHRKPNAGRARAVRKAAPVDDAAVKPQ